MEKNIPINSYKQQNSPLSLEKEKVEHKENSHIRKKSRKLCKGGYILSIIEPYYFITFGAQLISMTQPVYYIPKVYTGGDPNHETCALVGIRVQDWTDLLTDDSQLIRNLRKCSQLSYIQDIIKLTSYHLVDNISKFKDKFKQMEPTDLILLNIEPRGNGHLEKKYPVPRLSIPGGTMEKIDSNSFEQCAFREFKEETGLDITHNYISICQEQILKKRYSRDNNHHSDSKQSYKYHYHSHKEDNNSFVAILYLVRIVTEEEKQLYDFETGKLSFSPPPGLYYC
jgi:8-oxo-dGTP pyrophosphatase MutT (NUDIX family)